jgi:hypothetical protein
MDSQQFESGIVETSNQVKSTLLAKNSDYSRTQDVFFNIKLQGALLQIKPELVLLSRLMDKVSRLSNLIENNDSKVNETLSDTALDLIGYSIMLYLLIKEATE